MKISVIPNTTPDRTIESLEYGTVFRWRNQYWYRSYDGIIKLEPTIDNSFYVLMVNKRYDNSNFRLGEPVHNECVQEIIGQIRIQLP